MCADIRAASEHVQRTTIHTASAANRAHLSLAARPMTPPAKSSAQSTTVVVATDNGSGWHNTATPVAIDAEDDASGDVEDGDVSDFAAKVKPPPLATAEAVLKGISIGPA